MHWLSVKTTSPRHSGSGYTALMGKTDILITLHNGVELKGYIVVKNYTKFMATLLKTPVLNIFFCNVFQLQVIQVPRTNNFHV